MKKTLIILFLLTFTYSAFCQKYSYGKIPINELEEQHSSIDVNASAEIIHKDVYLMMDVNEDLEIQVTERIKIYDKDKAEEFLTYEVPLRKNRNNIEKISGFRASTYNLENGQLVETKIKNDQTFTEEKHKYLNLYKFTFPNVRNGSILEYKYTITSPWKHEIPIQYFDYKIPLRFMNYEARVPSIFYFIPDMRGQNSDKVKTEKKIQEGGSVFPYTIVNLKIENVKPYEEEPFVLNYQNVRTSIRYELAKIDVPGQIPKSFATTWKEVGETLLKNEDFGNFYNTNRQFREILPSITEGLTTNGEKASAILQYIQKNYIWDEYTGVLANQSLGKVIKTRTGNSGDLNLLLVAMLRESGIDANPIVLSTVSNGMLNYTFPSLQKLNYVIAGYYDGNKLNILDATSKYSEINQVPKRALNYRGFYIKKDNIHEVNLSNTTQSTDSYQLKFEIKPDLEFVGTMGNRSTRYLGMSKIEEYEGNQEQFEKNIRKKYSFPLENLTMASGNSAFRISFGFSSASNAEKIGDKIVFNPLIFLAEKEQIFKAEKRSYPIELGSPIKYSKNITVIIPEGYKIEDLPQSRKFLIEGDLGSFTYIIKTSGNQIDLKTELLINEYYLPSDYYEVLKQFWQHMIETEGQLVSLVKE